MIGTLMAATSGDPLLDWLRTGGAIGVLALNVIAFLRGWIVSGKDFDRVLIERDRALELVYQQAEIARRALDVTEKKVT